MRLLLSLLALLTHALPTVADTCRQPVCLVARDTLPLSKIITFDDVRNSLGIGSQINTILARPGARIGERFLGQTLLAEGDFDRISGTPHAPLTVLPGAPGQTLGALHLMGTVVIQGLGPRGYPNVNAVGEGSIAILFDRDQSALAFDLRGGELGTATVIFLRRNGTEIARLTLGSVSEQTYAFQRAARASDIGGLLIQNADPQGISIDNLAFAAQSLAG